MAITSLRLASNLFKSASSLVSVRKSSTISSNAGPLQNIRVLDLTRVLAGPFCTMILGDLGAEVIKVEKPGEGDDTRSWGPPFIGSESCYFISINRNKKSIAINMKDKPGMDIIKKLAKQSDILVENFVPGKLDKLGLGYSQLKSVAPQLIYCSITGYGPSGPYGRRSGYDVIAASIGGLLGITGTENGEPCKVGVAVTDLMTGLFAHGAIMAALVQRQKSGVGQKIDCNLLSTQIATLVNVGSNYLNGGLEGKPWGTAHQSIVPYQAFKTVDGYITVGAGNNAHFKIMCKRLKLEKLLESKDYVNNEDRVKNRKPLLNILEKRFLEKTTREWLEVFENSEIPYGAVNPMKNVFSDPQVIYSEIIKEFHHPTAGKIKLPGYPVQLSNMDSQSGLRPPLLGEHTEEILKNLLRMDSEEIGDLKKQKIIQCCE